MRPAPWRRVAPLALAVITGAFAALMWGASLGNWPVAAPLTVAAAFMAWVAYALRRYSLDIDTEGIRKTTMLGRHRFVPWNAVQRVRINGVWHLPWPLAHVDADESIGPLDFRLFGADGGHGLLKTLRSEAKRRGIPIRESKVVRNHHWSETTPKGGPR